MQRVTVIRRTIAARAFRHPEVGVLTRRLAPGTTPAARAPPQFEPLMSEGRDHSAPGEGPRAATRGTRVTMIR